MIPVAVLKAALAALPTTIAPRIATTLGAVAAVAAAEARRGLPEGPLADSISSGLDTETGAAVVTVASPSAPYVEYGTRHAAARPFLRPAGALAAQAEAGALAAAYADAVKAELDSP